MRAPEAILADIAAHRARRPQPPGGWISQLSLEQYRIFSKELDAWRDTKDALEIELALSRKAEVVVFITAPIEPDAPKASRKHPEAPAPTNLQILLSDMEAREKALAAAYTPGDRDAYIKIRNLRAGINMRRERYGLPCLFFDRLPRPTHKRSHAA